MIEMRKEYVINSSVEKVWNFLTDLQQVTSCIPSLENVKIETPTRFKAKVKPPFSFIKGRFNVESEVKDRREGESLTIGVRGSSIGASFEITMAIAISSISGTRMQVEVRAETFGLLKTIPKSLIYRVVEGIEAPMLKCIKERLE